MPTQALPDRFWTKVDKDGPGGCWIWTAGLNTGGYGSFWYDGKLHKAHRVAYAALIGEIPSHLELDHLCRRPICVNPKHLEPVTHRVNVLRGVSPAALHARKTHCNLGHPFSGENLYVEPSGERRCRECTRVMHRRLYADNRESVRAARNARLRALTPEQRESAKAVRRASYHAQKEDS